MNIIMRPIINKLEKELVTKEIVVLTGMRRVGKTTALKYLFNKVTSTNKVFLDLENPLYRKIFEETNYDTIWQNLSPFGVSNKKLTYIFLDEIQNLPGISSAIKYLYDHYKIKFILTGSSSFYLKNLFPESMAGRKIVYEIYPLSFSEFLEFKEIKRVSPEKNRVNYLRLIPYFREYLEFGGFPGVVTEENHERKKEYLSEIFQSYFEKDVKNLSDFKEIAKVRDLILLLAARVGSKLDISKLASEMELNRITVDNYINFLEQTYFITLLPRFSPNIDAKLSGRKKVYFCDSGIVNFLGKISEGQLFEQTVFQNLRIDNSLCYFDREGESEIDFIANSDTAYEAKITPTNRDAVNLQTRGRTLDLKNLYLVSLNFSSIKNSVLATDL